MPDNSPLLASLLMGQRQEENPFQAQRKYGRQLIVNAGSTAPLGSGNPLEGLARALQGGIGGWVAGDADRQEKEQNQNNVDVYARAAIEKDPAKVAELLKGLKGGGSQQEALFGQIIQNNVNEALKQQQAGTAITGMGGIPGLPAQPNGPTGGGGTSITITPRGPNPNNVGNISDGRGGFTQPASPQAGASDLASLLRSYPVQYNNGQPMTLNQIAQRYNPPDDGRNPQLKGNDPAQWARNVAQTSGLDPNQPLDFDNPAVLTAVVRGINPAEKAPADRQPASVLQQGVQQAMDPAAFPPQAAPGVAGATARPPQQMAQGDTAQPVQPQIFSQSPAGDLLRSQARQAYDGGAKDKALTLLQEAVKADAAYATEAGKIGLQGTEHDRQFAMTNAEHDRQQQTATPNNEQALSSTFANRMLNSNQIVGQFGNALANRSDKMLDAKIMGVGIPFGNDRQSAEYQQAKQARNDFINAQLRRESGAAISDAEYERADQQYFPQPGDKPEVLAQKAKNRQLAVEGMIGNAGPTFKQSPTVGSAPQQATPAAGGVSDGATATNPQTGQKIVFRGGQWAPVQ